MPKIVDHDARREEIARALWRVVRRDGIGAASVRSVAAEAGWSPGAVRHYFPDQAGLLGFAVELVARRAGERIDRLETTGPATEQILRYLEEVIPLDDERRAEFEVWFAFLAQSLAENEAAGTLRPHVEPVHGLLFELCRNLLTALADDSLDLDLEAARLHALVDGVSIHIATNPTVMTAAKVRDILRRHLETLTK